MSCSRAPGTGVSEGGTWANWAQNVVASPQRIFRPDTVDQLVAIVGEAEANNTPVRAVGSAWSFTDVWATPGYLVLTDRLRATLSVTMTGETFTDPVFQALTPSARGRMLCHVEAGIRIHDLYKYLDNIGYALKTLGGSGGQSIVGAITTSTHGGDELDTAGNTIPVLPDMVQGIHLVAAGGVEFFIQRSGAASIIDSAQLATLMPCVAGRIITNDDVLNAVMVSMGRMGIIYSVVLEVREQYYLLEEIVQDTWNHVSAGSMISELRSHNRFLQLLILPYANSNGDHNCFITTRNEVPSPAETFGEKPPNWFNYACDLPPNGVVVLVAEIITGLLLTIVILELIPIIGGILAEADIALAAVLTPLLDPNETIGDYLAALFNVADQMGLIGVTEGIVNAILSNALSPGKRQDVSYKIMDTYDYHANCYKALSLEVAFDADAPDYREFVGNVLEQINLFANQNILVGAYISLRFCAGSSALLAIEQWKHTVCIEMSALGGLTNDVEVLGRFEQLAIKFNAKVHWGQMNDLSRAEVERAFPGKIDIWRQVLARVSAFGNINTFDNDFCVSHGLETYGATFTPPWDRSYTGSSVFEE
jgi:hypothetical protein